MSRTRQALKEEGFVSPVIIQGKLLLRELISQTKDWDEPLPVERKRLWETWRDFIKELGNLHIDRTYVKTSLTQTVSKEVHIFCDASEQAIAAVAYLFTTDVNDVKEVGFIMGKSKVAPSHGHTVPRVELCAAVLAVDMAERMAVGCPARYYQIPFPQENRSGIHP
ncbi:uncharacterized protein LOC135473191 [Liolophura sinensis]|uniref:uncharacterized protein LOC135473191 n=1 Tax=Liolophura sinensis TaxID=3198878 RepID=UPI0031590242